MLTNTKNERSELIIGVDLDDVVLDFNNSLHAYHNKTYGTAIERKDITNYFLENVWKCSHEEVLLKLAEFYSAPEHDDTLPVKDAAKALALLKEEHVLHLITSRNDQIRDITVRWVDKNFPDYFKTINFVNQVFDSGEKRLKADVCKELGIDIMIEDSLDQAREITASGHKVFLLDCPWNQGELPVGATRVNSWNEIVGHIAKM